MLLFLFLFFKFINVWSRFFLDFPFKIENLESLEHNVKKVSSDEKYAVVQNNQLVSELPVTKEM